MEEFGLHLYANFSNLVKEQRAAIRLLELTRPVVMAPVKRLADGRKAHSRASLPQGRAIHFQKSLPDRREFLWISVR